MSRLPRIALGLLLSLLAGICSAQIEIHPLPENAPPKPVPLGAHALTTADAQSWLDDWLPSALKKSGDSGALVVIVSDGQTLLAKGYGVADPATRKPIDPATTLFPVGRISQALTWTAVLQLASEGKLDLDADVNRYLDFAIPRCGGRPLTLRALITHVAGFENVTAHRVVASPGDLVGNAAWVKRHVPACVKAPGEVPAYSDYDAALAGYIVQRVTGQPFADYAEQHLLASLGMRNASFRQPLPPTLAPYLAKSGTALLWVNPAPAIGLMTSGEAMARFMLAQLPTDGAAAMPSSAVPGWPTTSAAFAPMERHGRQVFGQLGDIGAFHSALALLPQQSAGLFVVVAGPTGAALRDQVLDGFVGRYFPPRPEVQRPVLASAPADGAALVGRYASSRSSVTNFLAMAGLFSQVQITQDKDGNLVSTGLPGRSSPLRHWREVDPLQWRDTASHATLTAHMQHGRVRWLAYSAATPTQVYLPLSSWHSAAWNLPLLGVIVLVFALVVVGWLLAAWRRQAGTLQGAARLWSRLSRWTALAELLFYVGWAWALWRLSARAASAGGGFDWMLRLIQALGAAAVLGTVAVAINAWHAWSATGQWRRKLGSLVLLAACLASLWFVVSLHLLGLRLGY